MWVDSFEILQGGDLKCRREPVSLSRGAYEEDAKKVGG